MSLWAPGFWASGFWATGLWQEGTGPTLVRRFLPPVFQTLKTSSAVKAIVGTNPPRIYRHGSAPQKPVNSPQLPYITWSLVSGIPENNLSDLPPVDRQSVQVDCWHTTDAGVEALAEAVRDVIEPVAHMTSVLLDERESDTKLYRIALQFDYWGR